MIEKMLPTTAGRLKIRMPTILNEITMRQMIELQEKHYLNNVEAISILSGISAEELPRWESPLQFHKLGIPYKGVIGAIAHFDYIGTRQ
jgi:hypothetical protein